MKFCTELKTAESYQLHELWYRQSRAAQSIAPLYYVGAPIIICSSVAFKLLMQNENRNRILTFPRADDGSVLHSGDVMSEDFVYTVGLLLLSEREFTVQEAQLSVPSTPVARRVKRKAPDTVEKYKDAREPSKRTQADISSYIKHGISDEDDNDDDSNGGGEEYEESEPQHPPIFFLSQEEIDAAFETCQSGFHSALTETSIAEEEAVSAGDLIEDK
jgi:hypothetical protein